jgi:hypothetical protein
VRIEVAALQDLLAGPEPERIVLCLSVAEDLGTENISGQDKAADQEKDIERRSQRGVSQHTSLSENG